MSDINVKLKNSAGTYLLPYTTNVPVDVGPLMTRLRHESTMPAAAAGLLGQCILYSGASTTEFRTGCVYKCEQDAISGNYIWHQRGNGGELVGGGMPIGAIFPFISKEPPEGAFLLNGQTIENCGTLYPDFFDWLSDEVTAGNVRTLTSVEYTAELAAKGNCGAFVISGGSVRLPMITTGFVQGSDGTDIGESMEAGLPNITSETDGFFTNTGSCAGGAVHIKSHYGTNCSFATGTSMGANYLSLDASRSSAVYGKSTTVQPASVRYPWCIQVFNATTPLSSQEAAELAAEMQSKAGLGLENLNATGLAKTNVIGNVLAFAGTEVPAGYLLCNGAAISRTDYAGLFAVIGTVYGAGDGSTTFNLPDLTNRVIQGNGAPGTYRAAGLPNISGWISHFYGGEFSMAQGAFEWGITGTIAEATTPCAAVKNAHLFFTASNFNAIYGSSATVQPPALTLLYCIKY